MKNIKHEKKVNGKIENILLVTALLVAVIIIPLTGGTKSLFLYFGAIFFPVLWISKYKQSKKLYITSENLGKSVLWGVLAGLGLTLIRIAVAQVFPPLLEPARMLTAHAAEMFHVQTIPLYIFLMLVFPGAILHGLFYWSFIQSRVLKYSKILIILPALLFAVAHIHEGNISIIHAFVVGLIASLLLQKTKNIAAPISIEVTRLFTVVILIQLEII
jgi:membrane protease YdiL (CAAX protease family)